MARKGVLEVLDLLFDNSKVVTMREFREKAPVSGDTLRLLKDNGLLELTTKEVPCERFRPSSRELPVSFPKRAADLEYYP